MSADDLITKGNALKAIMENAWPEDGTYGPDEKDIENAERATVEVCTEAIAALPAVAPGVRALEWEESVKGRWIGTAPVKLGNLAFWIFQSENGYLRHIAGQGAVTSPTLEAAKAAAQADYEARILAAIDTPAPAMGELAEALRTQASWVRAALNCASWTWDEDQREAAEIELAAADAVLARIGGQ